MSSYATVITKEQGGFEQSLRPPRGFAGQIMREDAWSFLIKLHALIESALNQALVKHSGATSSTDVDRIEREPAAVKVRKAKGAGLIDVEHQRFLNWFTPLRNEIGLSDRKRL